jgi:hypothetical protein
LKKLVISNHTSEDRTPGSLGRLSTDHRKSNASAAIVMPGSMLRTLYNELF